MALQLVDILVLLLLLVTVLFSIAIFFFTDRRPALAYLLAIYTPFQNVILPIIFALTTLPDSFGVLLITLKDSILLIGLLVCLVNINQISLRRVDVFGLIFVVFLFINLMFSESDLGASVRAFRSFAVPVALYAFGRLSLASSQQINSFVRVLFGVSVVVMILAGVDYIVVIATANPLLPSPQEYLADFYGLLGARDGSRYASGFLGNVPKLIGPFGNNLIMAAYLRTIICVFIFYLAQSNRTVRISHILFLVALFVSSALTLSRFAIVALYAISFLLLMQKTLWQRGWQSDRVGRDSDRHCPRLEHAV